MNINEYYKVIFELLKGYRNKIVLDMSKMIRNYQIVVIYTNS